MLTTIALTIAALLLLELAAAGYVLVQRPDWIRLLIAGLEGVESAALSSAGPGLIARRRHRRNPDYSRKKTKGADWRELEGPEDERVENQVISGLVNYGEKESAARALVLDQVHQLQAAKAAITFETLWRAAMLAYGAKRKAERPKLP